MPTDELVERLRTLGVFPDSPKNPNSVRDCAEVFERCETLDDIGQDAGRRHWSCGSGQFVYFHLEGLFKYDPEFKTRFLAEAQQQLDNLGIKPDHITEYYQSGADPQLVFMFRHEGEYAKEVRLSFDRKADQFAFNQLKGWLGLPTSPKR